MHAASTQFLVDISREFRGAWWLSIPAFGALAYLAYRVHAALLGMGREARVPSAAYAALVDAALVRWRSSSSPSRSRWRCSDGPAASG